MIRKKLELREQRDFGEKFNAVFSFVQANFKPLFKVIAFTVGPLALIGGAFFGLFYSKVIGSIGMGMGIANGNNLDVVNMMSEMGIAYFFLGVASLWMIIAMYSFMAEYESGNTDITVEAVWKRGKSKIWPTIGLGMLVFVAIFIFVMLIIALENSPGLIALMVILLIVALVYVSVVLSLTVPCMVIEGADLFESIGRSFELIRGKWWSTFGITMVMSMVTSFASMIFAIPFYIALFVSVLMQTGDLGDILMVISSCILFLGSFLMYSLPALAIGFQYYNLVERKEGTGLLKKIDQLGKPVNTANEGDY